jgi:SAM-dependent methyltransferase
LHPNRTLSRPKTTPTAARDIVESYGRTILPDGKPEYFRLHRYRFRALLAALPPPPAHVLEVGTTPGQFTAILRRAGYQVSGVDLFPEQRAELWRSLDVEVRYCNIDEQPLPYADTCFDAVVFSEVIEHLVAAPLPALREMARVLNPGGRLVLTTPNQLYIKSRLRTLADIVLGRPFESFDEFRRAMTLVGPQRYYNHSRLYTLPELRWLVEQSGLRVALARYADAWEQVGVEPGRLVRHPLRVAAKGALWLLTGAIPAWRSMLIVVGQKS